MRRINVKLKDLIVLLGCVLFFAAQSFVYSGTPISERSAVTQDAEYKRILKWEKNVNETLQPPEMVMDAIGVKPGMTIGEIGVGYGRYTVHLARRVGGKGKIYANDINKRALDFLRERCQKENIDNIEIILGEEEDPLFPDESLDMAFMVWVFHGLDKPGPLFKNLMPSLKPGALLVIVDPIDSEIDKEREHAGEKLDPKRPTIKQRVEKAAQEAGFEIIRIDDILPKDYIWFLQVKKTQ
jgi:ubiquinone/menaquinone biosynthesis C-methylase UbiE